MDWPQRPFSVSAVSHDDDTKTNVGVIWSFFGPKTTTVRFGEAGETPVSDLIPGKTYRIGSCYFTLSADGANVSMEESGRSNGCSGD